MKSLLENVTSCEFENAVKSVFESVAKYKFENSSRNVPS
jgi:hypothetical protein